MLFEPLITPNTGRDALFTWGVRCRIIAVVDNASAATSIHFQIILSA
jgi:hypothetical protein